MCPYLIISEVQNLCNCYAGGLMCPSIQETKIYCLADFSHCLNYQDWQQENNFTVNNKEIREEHYTASVVNQLIIV